MALAHILTARVDQRGLGKTLQVSAAILRDSSQLTLTQTITLIWTLLSTFSLSPLDLVLI
jgi:hypothetical protein